MSPVTNSTTLPQHTFWGMKIRIHFCCLLAPFFWQTKQNPTITRTSCLLMFNKISVLKKSPGKQFYTNLFKIKLQDSSVQIYQKKKKNAAKGFSLKI